MKVCHVLIFSTVILLGLPGILPGNPNKDQADRLARSGRHAEAISYYRRYLDSGQATGDFADVLLKASMLEPDLGKSVNLLLLYDKKMPNTQQRKEIFTRIGLLQEYLGNDAAAASAYQIAFENSYPPDYQLYLRVGFLSLESGDADKALAVSSVLLNNVKTTEVKISAIILALLSFATVQELENGLTLIQRERTFLNRAAGSSYYYALFRFYHANNRTRDAQRVKESILVDYPESVEAMLLRGKVHRWPSPLNVFF